MIPGNSWKRAAPPPRPSPGSSWPRSLLGLPLLSSSQQCPSSVSRARLLTGHQDCPHSCWNLLIWIPQVALPCISMLGCASTGTLTQPNW